MLLVRNNVETSEIKQIRELSIESQIEAAGIFIEKLNTLIISLYRPPSGKIQVFMDTLHDILTNIFTKYAASKLIVAGDINIDFLKGSAEKRELTAYMLSYGLIATFNEPSRVTVNTKTCIDQIFTNMRGADYDAETVQPHLSDHYAQKLKFCLHIKKYEPKRYIKKRKINEANTYQFKNMLKSTIWNINSNAHPLDQYTEFHETLTNCFDVAFPEELVPVNKQNSNHDWHTDELMKLKNNLDALFVIDKAISTEESKLIYENARKNYKEQVKNTKRTAIKNKINAAENRQKSIWNIIKMEVGDQMSKPETSTLTAEVFSGHFGGVGELIAAGIPGPSNSFCPFIANQRAATDCSMFMTPVSEDEIIKITKSLKKKTTKDIYGLTTEMLASIIGIIVGPLTRLVNACILHGVFPDQLKVAKVAPILKSGSANDLMNYRPISVLPALSKIFETVIKNRMVKFLEQTNFFTDKQHGFRKERSTITAILDLLDRAVGAMDRGQQVSLLCTDLSKAFDTVDHDILLQKLMHGGIRGLALKLMKSYLANRKQVVSWNGRVSGSVSVNTGVPQGSILGPILFICYVNDLPGNVNCAGSCLYADDASFLVGAEMGGAAGVVMAEADEWFRANNLSMNLKKTQSLEISTRMPTRNSLKLLGIYLSSDLTWTEHVYHLQHGLSSSIYAIRRIKNIAGQEAAKSAYFGCFHNKAIYGVLLWGGSGAAKRIFLQQKEAVRAIVGASRTTSCREIFKNLQILTLPAQYILACLVYVHGSDRFSTHSDTHNYNTRGKGSIAYPLHRLAVTQDAAQHTALVLYNGLPQTFKCLKLKKFKAALRCILLDQTIYDITEFLALDLRGKRKR